MIDFHDITVRDQRWIEPILHAANKPGADYTFTNMLFWTNYYGQVGRVGDFVTQYLHWEGRNIYLFPAGQGDLRAAVDDAYAGVARIAFDGAFHRADIAHRAFGRG